MTRQTTTRLPNTAFGAHSAEAVANDGAPKDWVQLFPMGVTQGRDGRGPFKLDNLAHAQRVVAASMDTKGSTDIPIDYDHQLHFGAKDGVGGAAPAAGWIKTLEARDDGIWGKVDWTDAATAKIKAREYRYISPFFSFDKTSGALTRIWHAGLVNFPNFTELAAVAGADLDAPDMDIKAVAKALGLKEDATIEQIATAAAALKAANDAKPAEIEAAAAAAAKVAGEPDPARFVPMASFKELQATVKTIQDTGAEAAATAAVDAAVAGGKITPAGRDHALKLYKASPEAFADFIGSAPVVLNPGAADTAAARANLDSPLSPEEKAAASAVGVSEEDYLKSKKQVMGAR